MANVGQTSGGGGGSTGMSMTGAFSELGHQILMDGMTTMTTGIDYQNIRRERLRQAILDAEQKRQANRGFAQTDRGQTLAGLDALAQNRQQASTDARIRLFRQGLVSSFV